MYNRRGFFLLSRKEHSRALKDFTAAIRLDKKQPRAFNNRGLVYLALNQSEKAIADFTTATKLSPKYADAWNNRGYALFRQRKFDKAVQDLSRALKVAPEYANALHNRGLVNLARKDYNGAVADFTAALKVKPFEIKLIQGRRSALLELKRFEEAQQDGSRINWLYGLAALTKRVEREPRNPDHYLQRGDYLAKEDEYAAAIKDYTRAAQIRGNSPIPLTRRAASLLAMGKVEEAIRDCDTAIEIGYQAGKKNEAAEQVAADVFNGGEIRQASYTQQATHDDDVSAAYSVRGDAWMKKGEYDKAIADYEKAKRFDSGVARAYLARANALTASGDSSAAQRARERAEKIDPSLKLR